MEGEEVSREEVLNRIREAEATRRKIEEEARQRKDRLLAEARKEVHRLLDDASAEGERAAAQIALAESKRIQQDRQKVTAAGQRQVELQREKCSTRLPAAVERIYQEFLRQIND
jgi:vacuolar-type H+-ATPase subunit H